MVPTRKWEVQSNLNIRLIDSAATQMIDQNIIQLLFETNPAWELTNLPPEKNVIACRWVYKIKY
ncbi:hypothetical protein MTR_1g025410 [Medicago truncatula]|uniref:Mitochondrial protein n=1 Tax=Medicago truncatula TaxID=3880 RepID=G7I7Q2_MEDTR|nr:hypothetical protein MTR_1g025410 [Medicago truncatula]